jgi:hypothetical protein
MMARVPCDCVNTCGDDPRFRRGAGDSVDPCPHLRAWRAHPRIVDVHRDATNPNAAVVTYDKAPEDADLRHLCSTDRWPAP